MYNSHYKTLQPPTISLLITGLRNERVGHLPELVFSLLIKI